MNPILTDTKYTMIYTIIINNNTRFSLSPFYFNNRPLRKSTSIPVHLTVGTNNEATLPPGLRPHSTCHLEHEPDCAAIKQGMQNMAIANVSSTQSLPNCLATTKGGPPMLLGGRRTLAAGGAGHATPPTGETVSSLQKKKVLR